MLKQRMLFAQINGEMQAYGLHTDMKSLTGFINLTLFLLTLSSSSYGGVFMLGTRIIVNEGDAYREVTLRNNSDKDELIQVWIDRGEAGMHHQNDSPPFIATPSIFKVAAHGTQTVRINVLRPQQFGNRESMYWFYFLQVFPKPEKNKNSMDFSLISAVKLFYRPEKIRNKTEKLTVNLKGHFDKKSRTLTIENDSPYHINISGIIKTNKQKNCSVNADGDIIYPFSSLKKKVTEDGCHMEKMIVNMIEDDGRISEESIETGP